MKYRKLEKILRHLNIKIILSDKIKYEPNYICNKIIVPSPYGLSIFSNSTRIINNYKTRLVRQITHEIGHYLVAEPKRRKKINYGIPELSYIPDEYNKWDLEEIKADLVGSEICRRLECKPNGSPFRHPYNHPYKKEATSWFEKEGKSMIDRLFRDSV